jgi:hypothetical protein
VGKQEQLAALLYDLKASGIDVGQCCVVDQGVFFSSYKYAKNFAETHHKELVRVTAKVSGWLAKNRPAAARPKRAKGA